MSQTAAPKRKRPKKAKATAAKRAPNLVQIYTRVSPAELKQLKALADADERPLMNYLYRLVKDHLQKEK